MLKIFNYFKYSATKFYKRLHGLKWISPGRHLQPRAEHQIVTASIFEDYITVYTHNDSYVTIIILCSSLILEIYRMKKRLLEIDQPQSQ